MMSKLNQKTELIANILIIVVAIALTLNDIAGSKLMSDGLSIQIKSRLEGVPYCEK